MPTDQFEFGGIKVEYVRPADVPSDVCDATSIEHWSAATKACCAALIQDPSIVRDKVVLEVGCGLGVLGIFCAKLGAAKVIFNDRDNGALKLAQQNITLNEVENCEVLEQDWSADEWPEVEVVVGSDVLYVSSSAEALAGLVSRLSPTPTLLLGHERRYATYREDGVIKTEETDQVLDKFLEIEPNATCSDEVVCTITLQKRPQKRRRSESPMLTATRRCAISLGSGAFTDAVAVGLERCFRAPPSSFSPLPSSGSMLSSPIASSQPTSTTSDHEKDS